MVVLSVIVQSYVLEYRTSIQLFRILWRITGQYQRRQQYFTFHVYTFLTTQSKKKTS